MENVMRAIEVAHEQADKNGKPFAVAYNPSKDERIVCCSLESLRRGGLSDLCESDAFYIAEPWKSIPDDMMQRLEAFEAWVKGAR